MVEDKALECSVEEEEKEELGEMVLALEARPRLLLHWMRAEPGRRRRMACCRSILSSCLAVV